MTMAVDNLRNIGGTWKKETSLLHNRKLSNNQFESSFKSKIFTFGLRLT